jgi:D-alanyl-lipoteichoic acid acyltransferase DltB (MBOAT superfamily)
MLFNSYPFVFIFLPLVLLGFAALTRWATRRAVLGFLIVASLVFYAWWNWRLLPLIVFSILFNYALGTRLARRRSGPDGPEAKRRGWLTLGIAVNLGLLAYFKYRNFLVEAAGEAVGAEWSLPPLVLPLAISFFTFEQITYLVDAYRGETGEYDFPSYALFICFFPHLIAGPIVRFRDLVPQFSWRETFAVSAPNLTQGLLIFAIGLFKKVMIADTFSPWVAPIFDAAPAVGFADAWGATLAFALQLYFDFSGYSDMAVGLALMLNVALPENFDSPYQARSISDFWRRWHMSLSSFLRDYLYIPLGGSRRGGPRRYVNLMVTMLLGGLWHGASWTFVLWGGLHGAYLVVNHLWRRTGLRLPETLGWAVTLVAVLVGWVFFRAPSLARALVILHGMAGLNGLGWSALPYSIGGNRLKLLLPALAIVLWAPNRQAIVRWRWRSDYAYAIAVAVLAGISILRFGNPSPFFYFLF